MERIIFHIDVNSAFLSWSASRDPDRIPDLRSIPSIIGGDMSRRHGIVLAKSIPAKKFGIVTGEPIVQAMRKCPGLVLEAPDMAYYRKCSQQLMDLLSSFCPVIEQVSIDECYMDYLPICREYVSPVEAAEQIRRAVRENLGFTVNIGISDRKVLAKMASDFRKPDLTHTLFSHEIQEKLWPLPIESLYMCGKSSVDTLHKLEINTIGQLALCDPSILNAHLKSHGRLLYEYANGIDDRSVEPVPESAKGIGNSTTLVTDALTRDDVLPVLRELSDKVAARLRHSSQNATMISTEIKYADFKSVSHQSTLSVPTNTSAEIYRHACNLFDEIWDGSPIRLLGIRSSRLSATDAPVQMSLFDYPSAQGAVTSEENFRAEPTTEKFQKLDKAMDAIRLRFGSSSVLRAADLPVKDGTIPTRKKK